MAPALFYLFTFLPLKVFLPLKPLHPFLKGCAVAERLVTIFCAIVVDRAVGEAEEGGYLLAVLHAKAQEGEHTEPHGQCTACLRLDATLRHEQGIEIFNEIGEDVEEDAVEACEQLVARGHITVGSPTNSR